MKKIIIILLALSINLMWACHNHDGEHDHDHGHEDEHVHEEDEHNHTNGSGNPNAIQFSWEQAAAIDLTLTAVKQDTIYEVIRTGAQVMPSVGDEYALVATSSGVVVYQSPNITVGSQVGAGQQLFSLTGGVTSNNVETAFQQAKSRYEQAKSNYERDKELYEAGAISKAAYEESLLAYQLAESDYNNLSSNYGQGGKAIKAKSGGYIKDLYKQEGEYAQAGEALALITQNKRLTIEAIVGQSDYAKLGSALSANLLVNGQLYSLADFNGRLLSYGKSVTSGKPGIPVLFEVDNSHGILPGSFVEVWIKARPVGSALVVPKSALLEDYGGYSVMVHLEDESYEKREVEIGISDGKIVQITSGLKAGEQVVSKGAFQVKMAANSTELPHGHSH